MILEFSEVSAYRAHTREYAYRRLLYHFLLGSIRWVNPAEAPPSATAPAAMFTNSRERCGRGKEASMRRDELQRSCRDQKLLQEFLYQMWFPLAHPGDRLSDHKPQVSP